MYRPLSTNKLTHRMNNINDVSLRKQINQCNKLIVSNRIWPWHAIMGRSLWLSSIGVSVVQSSVRLAQASKCTFVATPSTLNKNKQPRGLKNRIRSHDPLYKAPTSLGLYLMRQQSEVAHIIVISLLWFRPSLVRRLKPFVWMVLVNTCSQILWHSSLKCFSGHPFSTVMPSHSSAKGYCWAEASPYS